MILSTVFTSNNSNFLIFSYVLYTFFFSLRVLLLFRLLVFQGCKSSCNCRNSCNFKMNFLISCNFKIQVRHLKKRKKSELWISDAEKWPVALLCTEMAVSGYRDVPKSQKNSWDSALGPRSHALTSFRSGTFLQIHFVIFAYLFFYKPYKRISYEKPSN